MLVRQFIRVILERGFYDFDFYRHNLCCWLLAAMLAC